MPKKLRLTLEGTIKTTAGIRLFLLRSLLKMTARTGAECLDSVERLRADTSVEDVSSAFCKAPILMLMGSNDRVTSLPFAQQFYNRIQNPDKRFEIVNGAYHVLLDDYNRACVLEKLLQEWLHVRIPVVSADQ